LTSNLSYASLMQAALAPDGSPYNKNTIEKKFYFKLTFIALKNSLRLIIPEPSRSKILMRTAI